MPSLPQTHNALSQAERSRLVRSNRKLQALLGATPQVIEAAVSQSVNRGVPTHTHAPNELSSIPPPPFSFSGRRNLLPPSLASNTIRPQLFLHLEPPAGQKNTVSSLPSPMTPCTPLSPTTNTAPSTLLLTLTRSLSTKDTRRRHVAKLTRTLGENIAPDLITQPVPPVHPTLHRSATTFGQAQGAAERPNVRAVFTAAPAPASAPTLAPAPVTAHLSAAVDADIVTPVATPMALSPLPWVSPLSPRQGKPTQLARSFSTATREPRPTRSPGSRMQHRRGGSLASIPSDLLPSKEARELARELEGAQIVTAWRHELQTGKRRKEKEWSGEWNREMDKVAKELRSLKSN
ncbi:hypothetical protein MVEN_02190000 [Mycena venus]|uniref:Uncharacterized protein n=1 Tax=Mycena venus TaxID=2733690 RepID=A0A8H6X7B4_9AGAR|nr:hypothetical protein MVEN_02190000 [Mycena venus]